MNDIKLLKKQLEIYKRKYNAEVQANKSLIDANTKLVDKDRLLMFEMDSLKTKITFYKDVIKSVISVLGTINYSSVTVKYVVRDLKEIIKNDKNK